MHSKRLTIILLSIFLLPTPALAAKWVALSHRGKVKIEVISDGITTVNEDRMRLWHREIYASPILLDSGAFSFSRRSALTEFQCDKRLVTPLQQTFATSDGIELKSEPLEAREAQPLIPDSVLETVFNYACRKKPKPAVVTPPPPVPEPVIELKDSPVKSKKGKKTQEAPPPPPPPPAPWSYSGTTGAEKWGSLSKDYAVCSQGQRQTPIDIRNTVKADLPAINFAYKTVPLSIIDNGHSIQVDTPDAGNITVEGETYELIQFHFHKPSEEKINGKIYDMVVHLVHQSKDGKLAVVAVLLDAGKEHSLIRTLWTHLPLETEKPLVRNEVQIDPNLLLPSKRSYYTFFGSLTTPPCSEGVLWLVLKTPMQVSKEQLAGFATRYKNNARPIQGVNNRVIKESR